MNLIKQLLDSRSLKFAVILMFITVLYLIFTTLTKITEDPFYLRYTEMPIIVSIFSIISCILPAFFLEQKIKNPEDIFITLFYFFVYIPICLLSLYWHESFSQTQFNFNICFVLCFLLITITTNSRFDFNIKCKLPEKLTPPELKYILLSALVIYASFIFYHNGFHLENLSKLHNTALRLSSREFIDSSYIIKYSYAIVANLLLPFSLIYFLHTRSYYIIFVPIIVTIYLFSITAAKMLLAAPILYIGTYCLIQCCNRHFIIPLGLCMIFAISTLLIDPLMFNEYPSAIIRRAFITHSALTAAYVEYFSQDEMFRLLADSSLIRQIFDLPTPTYPIPQTIGLVYFGSSDTWANENFLTTAYADFGILGIFGATFILIAYFKIYKALSNNKDFALSCTLLLPFSLSLTSAGLPTALLSGCGIIALLMLPFLPKCAQKSSQDL